MADKSPKNISRSLIIIYTGPGKGKTTAALGLALRAIKADLRVLMIQFLKSNKSSGEIDIPKKILPKLNVRTFGQGFIIPGTKPNLQADKLMAQQGLAYAHQMIKSKKYAIIILDEISLALSFKLTTQAQIIKLIKLARQNKVHLVLTGRDCPKSLYQHADLVTEMKEIKHPFQQGHLATKGIDY